MSTDKRQMIIELQQSLITNGQLPTCTSCEQWNKKEEKCELYQMRPPANVIVVGCPTWIHTIPF